MKKYALVAAVIDLNFDSKLSAPIKIQNDTYISNNTTHFKRFIKPETYYVIGSLEGELLFKGGPVVYKECKVTSIEESHVELVEFMRDIQAFFLSMWMIKDNSANIELAFAISQSDSHVHSNSLSCCNTQQNTTNSLVIYSTQELQSSADWCNAKLKGMNAAQEPKFTISQKQINRLNVAASFLQQARSSSDIGVKIANYCSYFEALMSTSSAELTHQLAERAAFLLREKPEDRYEHFKLTKKAYAVRSKVVHGDVLSNNQLQSIEDVSNHCDQVARELLIKALSDTNFFAALEARDHSILDKFLIEKVFGIN
ncbi:hypothetical protein FQP81_01065 [Pseudoalteromonas distincta]|jgi:hypothetical protein|uniref:HEPN domain-containing protein n=1 Tax=Pseudoalteromonas TaxID=53246 RepID=UPI00040727AB|nr:MULTISPECIES: HEPN domain-containing protein [Pseudoalteromonas]TVU78052.1 hypothetical protein FQP81_01065 [Pseudoalteromonas elyakovii]